MLTGISMTIIIIRIVIIVITKNVCEQRNLFVITR